MNRKKQIGNLLAKIADFVSCEHFGSIAKSEQQNRNPAPAVVILRGGATERVRDDFLMRSIKKSSRTSAVRDDDV